MKREIHVEGVTIYFTKCVKVFRFVKLYTGIYEGVINTRNEKIENFIHGPKCLKLVGNTLKNALH